jgi:hypothetical protein
VSALDLLEVHRRLGKATSFPTSGANAYSPFGDIDGNGRIDALDYLAVRSKLLSHPPAAAPAVAPVTAGVFSAMPLAAHAGDEVSALLQ